MSNINSRAIQQKKRHGGVNLCHTNYFSKGAALSTQPLFCFMRIITKSPMYNQCITLERMDHVYTNVEKKNANQNENIQCTEI